MGIETKYTCDRCHIEVSKSDLKRILVCFSCATELPSYYLCPECVRDFEIQFVLFCVRDFEIQFVLFMEKTK